MTAEIIPIPTPVALAAASSQSAPMVETSAMSSVAAPSVTALAVVGSFGAGFYAGTILVTLGLLAVVAVLLATIAARGAIRRGLAAHVDRRRLADRRYQRRRLLEDAGVARDQLAELTVLCDEIERRDAKLAEQYDTEGLLDRHVQLTLAHERCLHAMRMCDRDQLARARVEHQSRPGGSGRRAAMFERRMRYWDRCKAQADRCDEDLSLLADMVRLLAQRAICPPSLVTEDEVERELDDLDDVDRAFDQMSKMG